MGITTRDDIAKAIRILDYFNKTAIPTQTAGTFASHWTAAGTPSPGANPTTAAIVDNTVTGAFPFGTPVSGRITLISALTLALSTGATWAAIHDRLAHMGALDGTSVASQTVNVDVSGAGSNLANRRGASDYSEVQWWIEGYTDLGATSVTANVGVTYDDNSTDTIAITIPATMRRGRMLPIVSNTAGRYIKTVNTLQLSASTTVVGNFGVTATRWLTDFATYNPNDTYRADWAKLGLSRVHDSAALFLIGVPSVTGGNIQGSLTLVQR